MVSSCQMQRKKYILTHVGNLNPSFLGFGSFLGFSSGPVEAVLEKAEAAFPSRTSTTLARSALLLAREWEAVFVPTALF